MAKEKKIGLVLPGGGFHGSFQAGVLKYLEEIGIKFHYVVASSIGCANAAILGARDGSAEKICEFWRNVTPAAFFYPAWREWLERGRVDSFCTTAKIEEQMFKVADIYDQRTDMEVEISLLNLDTDRVEYICTHDKNFKEALRAGGGMVPIYPAVFLPSHGHQYVDGGLGRNYMIPRCFENGCDYVVLINLIETQKTRAETLKKFGTERNMKDAFWRISTLVIRRVFADSAGQPKYDNERVLKIFSPRGTYFSILLPSNWWFRKMINVGYEEAGRVFAASNFLSKLATK